MADPEAKTAVQPQIETAKPGAFTPPRQIGPFELIKLLGRGGMAAVFEARHVKSKDKVALKVMDPNLRSDRTFVERFLQEVKACAAMEHPHVVKVLDHGESDGWYFLATELVEGGTVADLITQMQQLPAALALELGAQLLDGLAYAHAQGIVHRDLKPENLLLTKDGVLKVADFGIARTADHTKLTKTGMLVGTAGYMSPEQAKGSSVDGRSDLFTVGIIFYEMLTGANPFESDNPAASITRILEQDVPPLFELRPTVPSELEAVVDKLLAGNPEERFEGAAEAQAGLLPLLTAQRAQQPSLVAESLAAPKAAKQKLERAQAAALVAEAQSASASNVLESSRAALKLHLATLLDPDNAEAKRQLDELSAKHKLRFGPSDSAKIRELEAAMSFTPKNAMLLAQLANLYRLEGNLVRSASYLKRYLKLKPNDVYLSGQLTQLTGERRSPQASAPRAAAHVAVVAPFAPVASPAPEVPPSNRSASEAGIFISRVDVEPSWLRAVKRLAPWLVVLTVAVAVGSWVSRQFDAAARDSEKQAVLIRNHNLQPALGADGQVHEATAPGAALDFDSAVRLERGGDFEHALAAYETLVKQSGPKLEREQAQFRKAKMLQALKRFAEAREAYSQFMVIHPGSPDAAEALLRRGECAAVLEDAAAAETDYSDFLSRHPSSPLVLENWVLRGELRARQRDVPGARADFRQVLDRLEPASPLFKRAQLGLDGLK